MGWREGVVISPNDGLMAFCPKPKTEVDFSQERVVV